MAASNDAPTTGLLNLEKELVCFICTEVLYQPLTLIDCLHTFCGSCLKEWFSHQRRKAAQSSSSSSAASLYTCPTCRAPVKDVQHNAMINTLLDMFLAANPTKDRSAEEKAEMAQIYKPGDQILLKVETHRRRERRARREEEEEVAARERRLVDEARERSRRDMRLDPSRTTPGRHSARSTSGQGHNRSRSRDERSQRSTGQDQRDAYIQTPPEDTASVVVNSAQSSSRVDVPSLSPPLGSLRHPDAVEARQRARTVAHQASLRSLVSASESGTGTGDSLTETQLMQDILAEGLLDGINVDELTEEQQDELSEIIAERYRQLHPERVRRAVSNEPTRGVHDPPETTQDRGGSQLEEADRRPRHASRDHQRQPDRSPRSAHTFPIATTPSRPPVSYTISSETDQTLAPPSQTTARRRRASDLSGRRDTSATGSDRPTHPGGGRNAGTRSATDLSERPHANANLATGRPRQSPRASELWRTPSTDGDRPPIASPPQVESSTQQSLGSDASRPTPSTESVPRAPSNPPPAPPSQPTGSSMAVLTNFEEPSITCARCSRPDIQYQVYKHCTPCNLDLCLRCYRAGRGCNHWFGFGHGAMAKFVGSHPNNRSSQAIELPHMLVSRQYLKPLAETIKESVDQTGVMTTSDPASRLQEGPFCDRCGTFASSQFWSCDYCNDGEWGFCNTCVNTHHCCTHPLLPVTHKSFAAAAAVAGQPSHDQPTGTVTLTSSDLHTKNNRTSPAQSAPSSTASHAVRSPGLEVDYVPLAITTNCDVCGQPIPTSQSRYHCPSHGSSAPGLAESVGDYDICSNCYEDLVKKGRVKREDGPNGWRCCPSGHRMIVTTFEADQEDDQRRVVLRDLVGGRKMTEADMTAWKKSVSQSAASADREGSKSTPVGSRGQWTWRVDAAGTLKATRTTTATLGRNAGRYPPDGGYGKNCVALWSYYPEEGEGGKGELMFPRHAEIREVDEINEDWWFGVYAGDAGVFPAAYVRDLTRGGS